jgi:hypothetical protein
MSVVHESPLEFDAPLTPAPPARYTRTQTAWRYHATTARSRPRPPALVATPSFVAESRDPSLLVNRMYQSVLALLVGTGLAAAFWTAGVPWLLSVTLIGVGLTELAAFVLGEPRRISPVVATGFLVVGAAGILLSVVAITL